jgi:hypothetical protein
MKLIITYLLVLLGIFAWTLIVSVLGLSAPWFPGSALLTQCVLVGGLGGTLYCLRAVYLHKCHLKDWDDVWQVWYYIRPVASLITGGISWLFLKAGLLVLDAKSSGGAGDLGFLALAFIAGYNVDKFLGKLEEIAEATWGIEKSGSSPIGKQSGEK